MNYLAHAYLSNNDEGLIIGNFIADHIRGNNLEHFPDSIKKGIILHRKIDSFTDNHSAFRDSKRLFYDGFEKYSGILIDIYFDHLLARNFSNYSEIHLNDFSENLYSIYQNNLEFLPNQSSRFLEYVLKNNIYSAYSKKEGIERVLYHLSHRINHGKMLNDSMTLFEKHEEELSNNFEIFFKDVLLEFR